jgi:tetratricopeptide (TPR) repeat protein
MTRSLVVLVSLCLSTSLAAATLEPPKAKERWISLTADEFQFISNASPNATLEIARNMLRMRASVGQVTRLTVRSTLPTKVFIFSNERAFAGYRDAVLQRKTEGVIGVFAHGQSGNFILIRGDVDEVDRTIYHELTHYFVRNTAADLPLWLNEGLAEYYSTFHVAGQSLHIGRPVAEHVLWLRQNSLIPFRDLFAMTDKSRDYNEGQRQGVFYAQSWALTHYLMIDNDRRVKLARFLSGLSAGKSVDEAFQSAFAMKYEELEQDLRNYVRRFAFLYANIPAGAIGISEPPKPEAMTHDAVLYQFGHLLVESGRSVAGEARRFLEQALKVHPDHAAAHADLGRLHDIAGRRADADAEYAHAVRLNSNDAEVLYLAASSLLQRYANAPMGNVPRAEMQRMRELFRRSAELDPKRAGAWIGLGATYLGSTEDLAAVIAALEKGLGVTPAEDEGAFVLAQLYANSDRHEDAKRLIRRLERSTDGQVQSGARALGEHLDRASAHNRNVNAINEAVTKANAGQFAEALAIVEAALPSITDPAMLEHARKFREQLAAMAKKKK